VTEDDTSLEEPTTQHIETTWRLLERHVERPKPGDDHCGRCIRPTQRARPSGVRRTQNHRLRLEAFVRTPHDFNASQPNE